MAKREPGPLKIIQPSLPERQTSERAGGFCISLTTNLSLVCLRAFIGQDREVQILMDPKAALDAARALSTWAYQPFHQSTFRKEKRCPRS